MNTHKTLTHVLVVETVVVKDMYRKKCVVQVLYINGDGTSHSIWHLYSFFWQKKKLFFTYVCQIIASIERAWVECEGKCMRFILFFLSLMRLPTLWRLRTNKHTHTHLFKPIHNKKTSILWWYLALWPFALFCVSLVYKMSQKNHKGFTFLWLNETIYLLESL